MESITGPAVVLTLLAFGIGLLVGYLVEQRSRGGTEVGWPPAGGDTAAVVGDEQHIEAAVASAIASLRTEVVTATDARDEMQAQLREERAQVASVNEKLQACKAELAASRVEVSDLRAQL